MRCTKFYCEPFKDRCRDLWTLHNSNPKARQDCSDGGQAWEEVKEESIVNGFLKAALIDIGPRDASGVFASPEPMSEGIVNVEYNGVFC
ncbi:Hypothetical protein PHPALM_12139 [Phytophthora palmivora]|uniref:Uncharacterized protein n=1 Tax=Phytophthora palmivora TaxID=4796 RepID=A0A2P4Y0I1_9STRA|nr:Hypothetical protein PHPALM_12139 [Phytophthora palmivora]